MLSQGKMRNYWPEGQSKNKDLKDQWNLKSKDAYEFAQVWKSFRQKKNSKMYFFLNFQKVPITIQCNNRKLRIYDFCDVFESHNLLIVLNYCYCFKPDYILINSKPFDTHR